jgi:hypothetical protein
MNRVDPRDRALLGAAWYAGYFAHAARAGVEAVTLAAVAGPSGVIHGRQEHAQPWFDESGARVLPSYGALAACARLQGRPALAAEVERPADVQALAAEGPDGRTAVLANLTAREQKLRIEGLPGPASARVLDETSFEAFCRDPDSLPSRPAASDGLTLSPYAVAILGPS